MKKIFVLFFLCFGFFNAGAQILEPVKWSYELKPLEGNKAEIIINAKIDEGWNLYAQEVPAGGPLPTEITFVLSADYKKQGKTIAYPKPTEKYDEMFEMSIGKWKKQARFTQKIIVVGKKKFTVKVDIEYMVCNDVSCIPLSENLKVEIDGSKYSVTETEIINEGTDNKPETSDTITKQNDSISADTLISKKEPPQEEKKRK